MKNTHADKTTETKSNAVANGVAVQQGVKHETFQLEDDHAKTIAQRKIHEAANSSLQVTQLKTIQALANNSSQIKQLKAVQAMADDHTAIQQKIKPSFSKVIQRVKATSFWLRGAFGSSSESMSDFRVQIGEEFYQELLKLDTEKITATLVDFFIGQPKPIKKGKEQWDLLSPLADVQLSMAKEALTVAAYDIDSAKLIYAYWVKYKKEGEIIFKLAKKILLENKNKADTSEITMQAIQTQIKQSAKTDVFERSWHALTGKKASQDLSAKEAKAAIMKGSGTKLVDVFPDLEIDKNDNQSANREKVNTAKKDKLVELTGVEIKTQNIIAPLIDFPSAGEIIAWCLDQAKTDLKKLQSFVTFLKSSFDQGIAYDIIGALVKGKESKLFAFFTLWGEDAISKLPPLIRLATIPTLELLLAQTEQDFDVIQDWLITKKMPLDDIKTLLSKNYTGDVFVALLSWSKETKLLIKLSNLADKPTVETFVTDINGKGPVISDIMVALGKEETVWQTITDLGSVKKQVKIYRMEQGVLGQNDTVINIMDKAAIDGDKADNEQDAVTNALDAEWEETLGVCVNRGPHRNDNGRLPFKPGVGKYVEWGILSSTGLWPGARRLVQDTENGHIYYTWTHYGDNGSPAFVLLK